MLARNKTQEILKARVNKMGDWYKHMIHPKLQRFIYEYDPVQQLCSMEDCPIRELGSVWDLENMSKFLNRNDFTPIVHSHLQRFIQEENFVVKEDEGIQYCYFKEEALKEPANISHSAFLILCLCTQFDSAGSVNSEDTQYLPLMEMLANGILAQQRSNGSYRVHFDFRLPDHGMELYSGEAMLALVAAYRRLGKEGYMQSVRAAFEFYSSLYYSTGHHGIRRSGKMLDQSEQLHQKPYSKGIAKEYLVFFANWMSQALSAYYHTAARAGESASGSGRDSASEIRVERVSSTVDESLQGEGVPASASASSGSGSASESERERETERVREEMRVFVLDLHDRIVSTGFYDKLKMYPRYASTVEVACALEGICDAFTLLPVEKSLSQKVTLREDKDIWGESQRESMRREKYLDAIGLAVEFLLKVQKKEGSGEGGYGYSMHHHIQRIDVTGHVANAFMKAHNAGISIPALEG